jgi:hypothetical protein
MDQKGAGFSISGPIPEVPNESGFHPCEVSLFMFKMAKSVKYRLNPLRFGHVFKKCERSLQTNVCSCHSAFSAICIYRGHMRYDNVRVPEVLSDHMTRSHVLVP